MKLVIEKIKENPVILFRRAGYVFQRKEAEQISFIFPMARSGYPRFHAYCSMENDNLIINLHLDQKKHTYGDNTRHHGEYEDSDAVKKEFERLKQLFQ